MRARAAQTESIDPMSRDSSESITSMGVPKLKGYQASMVDVKLHGANSALQVCASPHPLPP